MNIYRILIKKKHQLTHKINKKINGRCQKNLSWTFLDDPNVQIDRKKNKIATSRTRVILECNDFKAIKTNSYQLKASNRFNDNSIGRQLDQTLIRMFFYYKTTSNTDKISNKKNSD